MWRHVEVLATVHHPVERVFPHLADPTLWPRFVPAVVFRRAIDDGPIRVGCRWMATDRIGPFRFHFVDELAELEPNRRIVWWSSSPWNSRVEYRLTAAAGATHVRAVYEGDIDGPLRLLVGWLPAAAIRLILAQDFRRLERVLTEEERAARRWAHHRRAMPPAEHDRLESGTLGLAARRRRET